MRYAFIVPFPHDIIVVHEGLEVGLLELLSFHETCQAFFVVETCGEVVVEVGSAVAGVVEAREMGDASANMEQTFGGMMAALGMGIILSFLLKKQYHFAIYLAGFILVTYFGLNTMAVAVVAIIVAVLYYVTIANKAEKEGA